ncbi:MAG TPA: DUF1015 domain-containing protein [Gemmatimonadales bacterium]|nr:DUF1015 domain-containing protein [Gemmatimonadales bacterium]
MPFRGERYRASDRLSQLIAPPYDVVTPADRARLAARDAHNIVHVMLPEAPARRSGGDPYARAAELLAAWRTEGVLVRDPENAVYVMAQGERFGVFAAVRAEGYAPRRVRPHEQTHAGPKADRLALLRATRTNIESIFLLAPDPDGTLAAALRAAAAGKPDAGAELDGVEIRLWIVRDVSRFPFPASPLYIADGHHRFETASAYALENPAADRVLAFIASARDPGLVVLPTHRVIFGVGGKLDALLDSWRRYFTVSRVAAEVDRVAHLARLGSSGTACIVAVPDGADLALVLRRDAPLDDVRGLSQSPAVRALDVAIVEELVVKPLLRLGEATPTLNYMADARAALDTVRHGSAAHAVLLNPTKVEQVFAVADAGEFMPPKSTYFVPKVPSGLVLRPLA